MEKSRCQHVILSVMSLLRISTVQPQILFDGKRAVGVRFVREGGFTYEVLAEKEVIISSGAINSPHLLLLSGIGPKEELQKHGVCEDTITTSKQ